MRRGYGDSGGQYAESSGPCGQREYLRAAWQSASDLRAAVEAMGSRTDVSTNGMIAVGVSASGFASLALTANAPPGLAAAINFAGGRGSRSDNDVCDEDALVRAFATLGRTSRIPTLWIYAQSDKFFGPELARRMHAAFTGAGGRVQFIDVAPFGDDGAIANIATAAIARQGPRGIFRLSLREPAPGLCRLAEGSFRFPQRAPVDA